MKNLRAEQKYNLKVVLYRDCTYLCGKGLRYCDLGGYNKDKRRNGGKNGGASKRDAIEMARKGRMEDG